MDRTLILVKPDAFERGLTGEIIRRFERKGLTIVAMKHMTVDRELAEQHGLSELSMGMSDDLELAIAEGATRVRIGTAIFGPRERPNR